MYGDALTTKDRVKARLGITSTDWDDFFDNLILAITARIEQATGRRFIQATYTHELHDGSDIYGTRRQFLIVKNAPIQTVSTIEYNTGTNSNPNWVELDEDEYSVDLQAGLIQCRYGFPAGQRNVRITYTGGFSGYSIGVDNFWVFNITPTGTVNGSNRTFGLPEAASQVVVYPDGLREAAANVTFVDGDDEFTLAEGRAPFGTIAADYRRESQAEDADLSLPADLVEVCEKAVVKTYKRREGEGKSSETFQESSINWEKDVFTEEDRATIRNYRRGYSL